MDRREGVDGRTEAVSGAQTAQGFRLDIQGIRGLALVLVLCCHARLPWAQGGYVGLDVFYVLSGFLITGLILTEIQRSGGLSLVRFYARRARRLLPLAVTVLAVTVVVSALVFSPVRAGHVAGDAIAAALYIVNWRFVSEAVDYFAFQSPDVSPIQHYWSLSLEEQFYLAWPMLVFGVLAVARLRGGGHRALLAALLTVLTGASLAYGIWFSRFAADEAYFSSLARGWELGLGCVLALVLPAGLRLPRAASGLLAGAGVGALVWATVTFTEDLPYPGWHALIPTLATVAVIVAGTSAVSSAPTRLLTLGPLQYLGRISYAWYLWHWPALVFAAALLGPLTPLQSVAVTLVAWIPTVLSHHLVEERFRRSKTLARSPGRSLRVGVGFTAAAVVLAMTVIALQPTVPVASSAAAVGARAAEQGAVLQRAATAIRPDLRTAHTDRGTPFADGCHIKNDPRVRSPACAYGKRDSPTRVVLWGDSHGLQYADGMIALAQRRGWRLESLSQANCTPADVPLRAQCDTWRENTLRRIASERPALIVVATGTQAPYRVRAGGKRLGRKASEPLLEAGMERTLRRLKRTGAQVVLIRDQAQLSVDPADCAAENIDHLAACSFRPRRPAALAFDVKAARRVPGVRIVDPQPLLCPDDRCPVVIGNVLVYRDNYHLSGTFSRTMARWLGRKLMPMR